MRIVAVFMRRSCLVLPRRVSWGLLGAAVMLAIINIAMTLPAACR